MKEPEIKLFGMKITLLENDGVFSGDEFADERSVGDYSDGSLKVYSEEDEGRANFGLKHKQVIEEDQETGDFYESEPLNKDENPGPVNESHSTNSSSEMDDNLKTPSIKEVEVSEDYSNNTKEQNDPQQKTLKKPDKILPCPRCNSMDTKFCYYNNYNVNQPRHFCKNCQRYWTAGGMMRNVPVGAGRRKNKNSTSHFGHITISALTKFDAPNGFHHASFRPNGTVLSFGPDSPVCESMALNLTEKQIPNAGINVDDYSLQSSVTMPNSTSSGGKNGLNQPIMQNAGVPSTVPFLPGGGWSFPWNSAIPIPAICPPGHPMPFYPTPYWNCGVPNAWNVPWLPVPSPNTITQGATVFNPNLPLGKHSRNGELLKSNNPDRKEDSDLKHSESSIVIPKTLRFDDPEEAAKSSIWSTLGIKYDSISREGLFKALQPKGEEKKTMGTGSSVLQANPASLSRSINFQERA